MSKSACQQRVPGCVLTNAKGEYVISELQEGEYKVEFSVADGTYHSQYWDGKQSIGEGQLVPVAAGQAAAGVNAELEPASGAITGTVRDNQTNSAIKGIGVCAYKVGSEEEAKLFGQCTTTNSPGAYSILELAGGEYIVEFYSPAESKLLYATEYYDGRYSALNAETVHVVVGEHTANIDAALEEGGNIRRQGHERRRRKPNRRHRSLLLREHRRTRRLHDHGCIWGVRHTAACARRIQGRVHASTWQTTSTTSRSTSIEASASSAAQGLGGGRSDDLGNPCRLGRRRSDLRHGHPRSDAHGDRRCARLRVYTPGSH